MDVVCTTTHHTTEVFSLSTNTHIYCSCSIHNSCNVWECPIEHIISHLLLCWVGLCWPLMYIVYFTASDRVMMVFFQSPQLVCLVSTVFGDKPFCSTHTRPTQQLSTLHVAIGHQQACIHICTMVISLSILVSSYILDPWKNCNLYLQLQYARPHQASGGLAT